MIKTDRLIIRKFEKTDIDEFALLMSDPQVMEFSLKGPMNKKESTLYLKERILDHYDKYDYGMWALIDKSSNKLIGLAGLINQLVEEQVHTELAYRLHPNYWGKGFAKEACLAIIHFAKNYYRMKELVSIIDLKNTPSLRLSESLGFSPWKEIAFHGFKVTLYRKELD